MWFNLPAMKIFPTRNQWRGWTLPSKLTAVSLWIALLGLVVAIILAIASQITASRQGEAVMGELRELAKLETETQKMIVEVGSSIMSPNDGAPAEILIIHSDEFT